MLHACLCSLCNVYCTLVVQQCAIFYKRVPPVCLSVYTFHAFMRCLKVYKVSPHWCPVKAWIDVAHSVKLSDKRLFQSLSDDDFSSFECLLVEAAAEASQLSDEIRRKRPRCPCCALVSTHARQLCNSY